MQLVRNPKELYQTRRSLSGTVAFVPTMGALHQAHLSLVRLAKSRASHVVVSIFVNPLQFGPQEDFHKYPRDVESDLEMLRELSPDLVFCPTPEQMYPKNFQTRVTVGALGESLCGSNRPGHFNGVATVCLKLFQIVQPDLAIFGEKDFQQLRILQKMVEDFLLPVTILSHPIVREPDGLALSSRNRYLTAEARKKAASIPKALSELRKRRGVETTVGELLAVARSALGLGMEIEYLAIASEIDLVPAKNNALLASLPLPHFFLAVKIEGTRLIDNLALHGDGL